ARGWQTEHHDRKEARHEGAGGGIACEETMKIPGHRFAVGAGIAAEDKPDETVKDVMQTSDQEQPVEHTVNEKTPGAALYKRMADPVDASLHHRPDIAAK